MGDYWVGYVVSICSILPFSPAAVPLSDSSSAPESLRLASASTSATVVGRRLSTKDHSLALGSTSSQSVHLVLEEVLVQRFAGSNARKSLLR
ncbi:hypothetical protein RchiOBHm_Chr2g0090411 [Rosa chinensis]|uniref:Uncharacterized protein n=1 Tax=Rosa chinensis TaxID=74649 RepID=A0A2P6RJE9_ROSCH|nr:hypothetical protein RchiOBHm_Chr2g0090411 [Rosa chinensis]